MPPFGIDVVLGLIVKCLKTAFDHARRIAADSTFNCDFAGVIGNVRVRNSHIEFLLPS